MEEEGEEEGREGGREEDRRNSPMNKRILTTSQRFDRSMRNAVSLFPHTRSISIARYYVLRFNYSTKLWELPAIRRRNCHTYDSWGIFYRFFNWIIRAVVNSNIHGTEERKRFNILSFFFLFLFPFSFSIRFDWFWKSQSFFSFFPHPPSPLLFYFTTKIHGKHWFQLRTHYREIRIADLNSPRSNI